MQGRVRRAIVQEKLTLLSSERLDNILDCLITVERENIPGDFIETGVWKGGACLYAAAILSDLDSDRHIWCADSFEGLPKPSYPEDAASKYWSYEGLKISKEEAEQNFRDHDLLGPRIHFLKGWFKDTLLLAPIETIAVLRFDGDMYESTEQALEFLYDKVSPGGFVIIDDYNLKDGCCRHATDDFRRKHRITAPLIWIDNEGVYWRK